MGRLLVAGLQQAGEGKKTVQSVLAKKAKPAQAVLKSSTFGQA